LTLRVEGLVFRDRVEGQGIRDKGLMLRVEA